MARGTAAGAPVDLLDIVMAFADTSQPPLQDASQLAQRLGSMLPQYAFDIVRLRAVVPALRNFRNRMNSASITYGTGAR